MNQQTKDAIDGAFAKADEAFEKADEAFKAARNDPTIKRTYSYTSTDGTTVTSEDIVVRFKSETWRDRLKNFRRFGGMAFASLFKGTAVLAFRRRK